ncbi:E3 ubiquitin-protein ligase DTX3L-like isoform X1 [Pygocentrus nattereri]|uniref:E3 ubiquitin-protein ligase n=1 Tax=Pygocentrus nattereri TaxID=42514 RepID=A0A3B4BPN2_PYGNA|nr:E3 ubiquitin-protein ligase DTX3L-like isoform X1 [Pygocentrus nattereri]
MQSPAISTDEPMDTSDTSLSTPAVITQPRSVEEELKGQLETPGQMPVSEDLYTAEATGTKSEEAVKSDDAPNLLTSPDAQDLYTAVAITKDATKSDDTLNLSACPDAQDNNRSADSGTADGPKPSAPRDSAKVYIRVEWAEKTPDRWKSQLEKALQTWCNTTLFEHVKETCTVVNLQLLDDLCRAVVEISPSKFLGILKMLQKDTLTFKDLRCNATVHFLDETTIFNEPQNSGPTVEEEKVLVPEVGGIGRFSAFIELNKFSLDIQTKLKRRFGNPQFENSLSFSGPFDTVENFYREVCSIVRGSETGMAAASVRNNIGRAEIPHHAESSGAPPTLTVPLFHYWYFSRAFRNVLSQFEMDFGVKINAEVLVSVTSGDQTRSDDVAQKFIDLYQQSTHNLQGVDIPQTQQESEIVKDVVRNVKVDQTKMVLDMSADQFLLFGPAQIISRVEKEMNLESRTVLPRSHSNDMTSKMETDISRSWTLGMDIKDTPGPIEMNEIYWELMKKISQKQIKDIEQKYGVVFCPAHAQGSFKVAVQSVSQHVNLESHALRAFMHLYQKVATSAVVCTFKNPAEAKTVDQVLERLGRQDLFLDVHEKNNIRKLVGLPKHLGPAIADIEKLVGKSVFQDKTKKLLGYPGNLPQSWGLSGGQQGAGATEWTHGPSLNSGVQANNESFSAKEKENDKSKDDNCPICMDKFTDKTKLKCGHEFCKECLKAAIKSLGEICPVCKDIFGTLMGTQPDGKMHVSIQHYSLPGYSKCGTIEINYIIPDGIQTERHPNPGQHFFGTSRRAFLPDNNEGRYVLKLLQKAFDQKLIFTVGTSTTTGAQNVVIWNDIHHKTSMSGGPQGYGYPDPDYLKRVKEELKAKGIE